MPSKKEFKLVSKDQEVHQTPVERILFIGDSLSDRGEMEEKDLLGFIPMKYLSGVYKSGCGRFSNGLIWIDYFGQVLIDEFGLTIDEDKFNDADHIGVKGSTTFIRTYCEGGLTSADYKGIDTSNLINEVKEEILASLKTMRKKIRAHDKVLDISAEEKKLTLVVEWSGPNDLMTVTDSPTKESAERAAKARAKNVKKMIKMGYSEFVLLGVLDMSLAPRFVNGSLSKAKEIQELCLYFNEVLARELEQISKDNPTCKIHFYDLNPFFVDAYQHPEQFNFSKKYLTTPYIDNKAKVSQDDIALFLFWDEVHPTTKVHLELAKVFHTYFSSRYRYTYPEDTLIEIVREKYGEREVDKRAGCGSCSCLKRSPSVDYLNTPLPGLVAHAKQHKKGTTYKVLTELGIIEKEEKKKSPKFCIPV